MTVPSACETAVAHYLSKGITKDVAVGIASVLYHESNLNPISENNSGTETGGVINPNGSYGIAQWNGPRQAALKLFAVDKNEAVSALNTQLDFVLTEAANSYPPVWAAILQPGMTYQNFIPIYVNSYERPANEAAEVSAAMAIATPLYALSISPTPAPAVPLTPALASTLTPALAPAPAPAVASPIPVISGGITVDPALIAALAPIVEALAAGLFRALITQLSTTTATVAGTTTTPAAVLATSTAAAPAVDLASLANEVVPLLTSQLGNVLPSLIAAELAKLVPTTIGAKP